MPKRRKDVIFFDAPPVISAWGSAGGKKEGEGPLASAFDYLTQDAAFADENCANWEQAESMLQQKAAGICLRKAGIAAKDVDLTFAGDLQAQCTASNYTLRTLATPFAGLYGACSTMTEALCLGAAFTAAGLGRQILAMTSSHFCAAERQFRTPLEYGAKRTPTAQWTATAAGACLLRGPGQGGVQILSATFGRVQDYGVTDINNMGAAMMPAAASTLLRYFDATGAAPADFDAIFTGDLGQVGSDLLCEQMEKEGARFMDIKKTDIRKKRRTGAIIGAVVMILLMGFTIGLMLWANTQDPIPTGLLIFLIAIPVVIIGGILAALAGRMKEIEGGEEDEASKY